MEAVTLMGNRIGSGWSNNTIAIVDSARVTGQEQRMRWNNVGPDYFRVLGTPILLGRDFREADLRGQPSVIVNEAFAKTYLPNRQAIGHTVSLSTRPDARHTRSSGSPRTVAIPGSASPNVRWRTSVLAVPAMSELHVELRASGDPARLLPDIRRVVAELGPDLPLLRPMTQQAQFAQSFSNERMFSRLASAFGVLAALLIATGLYGTLSLPRQPPHPEIGIRMALGARRGDVVWMVVRDSLVVCAIGIVAGLPLAIAGSRYLETMLYGLTTRDVISYAGAVVAVALLALVASLIPARRAVSVDPMIALRSE